MLNDIKFENPDLLHLLWVLALQAAMLAFYWNWRKRKLQHLGSPELEKRLLVGFSERRFWLKNALFAVIMSLIALAIANPRKRTLTTPPAQQSADILIALDVSRSMMANDVSPNRLAKAKVFIQDLIKKLRNERIGLLVFAGDAFPQAPMTNDPEILLMFVRNAASDAVNDQGTDFEAAIQTASRMFPLDSEAGRAVIIVTDGENHTSDALAAAQKAHNDEGITIHTVAVGTVGGSTIPSPIGGELKDYNGQIVRTSVNETALRELASAGGGIAIQLNDSGAMDKLVAAVGQLRKSTVDAKAYMSYKSYFQWLVLAALILLVGEQLLWWRKGKD